MTKCNKRTRNQFFTVPQNLGFYTLPLMSTAQRRPRQQNSCQACRVKKRGCIKIAISGGAVKCRRCIRKGIDCNVPLRKEKIRRKTKSEEIEELKADYIKQRQALEDEIVLLKDQIEEKNRLLEEKSNGSRKPIITENIRIIDRIGVFEDNDTNLNYIIANTISLITDNKVFR